MLSCVDLFSGAGGFSIAAMEAGFRVMLAVENDVHAAATYRNNLCVGKAGAILIEDDISSLSPVQAREISLLSAGECDLLLGGPPCQGFSTHRIKNAGVSDKRNDLIHVYFDFVKAFMPRVFLMENVPGMLWPRHSSYLDRFYAEGRNAGYQLKEPVLIDARDFGVPQRRKRVFILGIRTDVATTNLDWPPAKTHGDSSAVNLNPSLQQWVDCRRVFEDAPANDPNDIHMSHGEELIQAFRSTPINGGSRKDSGRMLRCHASHNGHKDVYGRIDPHLPAPTMTTACVNPSKGRFVHPVFHHGITARQAARIQTFPDAFKFSGGLMAAGKQIGNAVPVALAMQLINHIKAKVLLNSLVSENETTQLELRAA